jgi:hypothetical protein
MSPSRPAKVVKSQYEQREAQKGKCM